MLWKWEFINTLYWISRFGKHYVNSNDSGLSVCLRNDVQMIYPPFIRCVLVVWSKESTTAGAKTKIIKPKYKYWLTTVVHTKMQWIILVVSPIKLNFPRRYHFSTFLGNGKTLCQIISNFIVTRNCYDKFLTMFNTGKWCWTHAHFSFPVYFSRNFIQILHGVSFSRKVGCPHR